MASAALVVTASTRLVDNANVMSSTDPATTTPASGIRMWPLPTSGGRSAASLRSGRARPRATSTRMMTRNGTDSVQPWSAIGWPCCCVR